MKILLAPNGKPSNLNATQYKLVRTPAFKKWFGDWEHDPANASKVVDENGEPLVVWHGTKSDIHIFDESNASQVSGRFEGFHFGSYKQAEMRNKQNIIPVFLNIKQLKRTKDEGGWSRKIVNSKKHESGLIYLNRFESIPLSEYEAAKERGIKVDVKSLDKMNDVEFRKNFPSAEDSYVVFNSTQIKLADGSNTTFDANNPDIRFAAGGSLITDNRLPITKLLAPNGKPSLLTASQYKLVRTPAFKKWFGDFENDPQNASKVVDENGEPLVCYHGTDKEFNIFNIRKINRKRGTILNAVYFSIKPDSQWGNIIIQSFLLIKNPLTFDFDNLRVNVRDIQSFIKEKKWFWIKDMLISSNNINEDKAEYLIKSYINDNNTNGLILKNTKYSGIVNTEYAVFNSTQIKLADGSNKTFDANNPDIRFSTGGYIYNKEKRFIDYTEDEFHKLDKADLGELLRRVAYNSHIHLMTRNERLTFAKKLLREKKSKINNANNSDIRFSAGGGLGKIFTAYHSSPFEIKDFNKEEDRELRAGSSTRIDGVFFSDIPQKSWGEKIYKVKIISEHPAIFDMSKSRLDSLSVQEAFDALLRGDVSYIKDDLVEYAEMDEDEADNLVEKWAENTDLIVLTNVVYAKHNTEYIVPDLLQ